MNTTHTLSSRRHQLAAFSAALVVTVSVLSAMVQLAGGYQSAERVAAAQPARAASQQVVVVGQRANGG